jgi:hypothetical protein
VDTLLVLALVTGVGYVLACAVWPFTACRRCEGTGKRRSPSGKAWRQCGRCDGSGRRVRAGRLVYELLTRHDD